MPSRGPPVGRSAEWVQLLIRVRLAPLRLGCSGRGTSPHASHRMNTWTTIPPTTRASLQIALSGSRPRIEPRESKFRDLTATSIAARASRRSRPPSSCCTPGGRHRDGDVADRRVTEEDAHSCRPSNWPIPFTSSLGSASWTVKRCRGPPPRHAQEHPRDLRAHGPATKAEARSIPTLILRLLLDDGRARGSSDIPPSNSSSGSVTGKAMPEAWRS